MKIARLLCLRAASRCDGAGPREGTQPVSHVRTAITYGQPGGGIVYTYVCVRVDRWMYGYAEASQKIIRILTCRRSQEAFGFAPRHAERIKLFTLDTYTKSIVEVSAIDKMNDGYTAPSVPPPLTDAINRLLQNRSFSMLADTLSACRLSSFSLLGYHPSTAWIVEIKSRRFDSFGETMVR